ncbi:hypothetical protein [Paenibacillus aestuarii]|uniref:Uncharacterized protein n=1 Tax=Paenibacillus aestuarii TaxID=516965 RepID=A0ABW0K410_9BACL|nr:hypothetical protein [Paenibacillus aestuarii]
MYDLRVGDELLSITNSSWLCEGSVYRIVQMDETEIVFEKGIRWPRASVEMSFVVKKPAAESGSE